MMKEEKIIEYVLMNPSDNYTILVLTDVKADDYEIIAKDLLSNEPLAEQVGFLTFKKGADISIRMAGGEFCGNATICAAVYYCMKNEFLKKSVNVKFFGIDKLLNVQVEKVEKDKWIGIVEMPKAKEIKEVKFGDKEILPVVFLDSIAHVIVERSLDKDFTKETIETKIKEWCKYLNVPALGVMDYDMEKSELTPIVYVEKIDTLYWENSCASGTAAIAYYLDSKSDKLVNIKIKQAGGKYLEAFTSSDKKLYLKGEVQFVHCKTFTI